MKNTTVARPLRSPTVPANHDLEACLPLVKAITARIRATRGPVGSFEDLYAIGLDGLLDAAERFDPARGVAFTTFAYYRVRGAILDLLRRETPGRRASPPGLVAEALPWSVASTQAANDNGRLDAGARQPGERVRWAESVGAQIIAFDDIDTFPDETTRPADEELDQRDLAARMEVALTKLSEEDRRIIEMHYYEELTFAEIGEKLGICKPWAFRRHQRAMGRLREAMAGANTQDGERVSAKS